MFAENMFDKESLYVKNVFHEFFDNKHFISIDWKLFSLEKTSIFLHESNWLRSVKIGIRIINIRTSSGKIKICYYFKNLFYSCPNIQTYSQKLETLECI